MSAEQPRGARVWLLVAAPLVAQLAFTGLGGGVLQAAGLLPQGDLELANLPSALLLAASYAVFAGTTLAAARALGEPHAVLALHRLPGVRLLGFAAAGLAAGVAATALLEPIFHGEASQRVALGAVDDPASAIAVVISVATVVAGAALVEELYFRGLLYGRVDGRLGTASAVVASAGVFGLAHFEPKAFPVLFALGLILGVLRSRSGSIWPGVAMHAANNGLAIAGLLVAAR